MYTFTYKNNEFTIYTDKGLDVFKKTIKKQRDLDDLFDFIDEQKYFDFNTLNRFHHFFQKLSWNFNHSTKHDITDYESKWGRSDISELFTA